MSTEEVKEEKLFGLPIGSWIQWLIPALVAFSAYYITTLVGPLDERIKKLEDTSDIFKQYRVKDELQHDGFASRLSTLESDMKNHEKEMAENFVTKQFLNSEIKFLNQKVENAKHEHPRSQ
jgi:septal ring factor EnvC (AmiA/AmiB activator)